MDADGDTLTVGLFADDSLDVDSPLKTVDTGDLALTTLVRSTDNRNLVVLADGDSTDLEKVPNQRSFLFRFLFLLFFFFFLTFLKNMNSNRKTVLANFITNKGDEVSKGV